MMSNTISRVNGLPLTKEGQNYIANNASVNSSAVKMPTQDVQLLTATGAEVAKNIVQNMAEIKQSAKEMQKLSNMLGRKIQFNVNQDSGNVVIKVMDLNTNEVIREIPSADMQRLQARLRKTIGILFDTTI